MVRMGMELPLDAICAQIASGIDILIHLGRLRDGTRKVLDIRELTDYREGSFCMNSLYRFRETGEEGSYHS